MMNRFCAHRERNPTEIKLVKDKVSMNLNYKSLLNFFVFNSAGFPIRWASRRSGMKFIFFAILLSPFLIGATKIFAQASKALMVTIQGGESIRDLAQKYLGDADLWTEILKSSGLQSAAEIKPGMTLNISSDLVQLSQQQLQGALQAIQNATEAGAKVFAADSIAPAIALYDQAVAQRKNGEWQKSIALARAAKIKAENAGRETLAKRNTTGEAELTDRKGTVERRKPAEPVWKEAPLKAKLIENETVRTLSSSLAEITFHDDSRIRLNENSQAVIQKMRADLLAKKKESSVSLVTGNAFALLASNQKKKNFEFNIPGVTTKVHSKNFWVQKDEQATKVANYEGEIELTSQGATVVVGENQGALVQANQKPTAPTTLLPSPSLVSPEINSTLFDAEIAFSWNAVANAAHYWLEVSRDKSFTNVIINSNVIPSNSFKAELPGEGSYYWRVAAIDGNGLPSRFSERGFFNVTRDATAPFLQLTTPEDGVIVRESFARVTGTTEKGAILSLNGKAVPVTANGLFESESLLKDGANEIILEARDRAGNVSRIHRNLTYVADSRVGISYSSALKALRPKHFVVPASELTLSSASKPRAAITLLRFSALSSLRTFADDAGYFQFTLRNLSGKERFSLSATTPAGYSAKDTFMVEVDNLPPQIKLEADLPAVTASDTLRFAGAVLEATSLQINGVEIKFANDRFAAALQLKPGLNLIQITAQDFAGNVTTLEKRVLLDREPPKLLRHQITPQTSAAAKLLQIEVKAQDASALKRTAKFLLQSGSFSYSGYLKFNPASQTYEETVTLPSDAPEGVKLKSVVLEDYYGNQKEYQIN